VRTQQRKKSGNFASSSVPLKSHASLQIPLSAKIYLYSVLRILLYRQLTISLDPHKIQQMRFNKININSELNSNRKGPFLQKYSEVVQLQRGNPGFLGGPRRRIEIKLRTRKL